MGLMYEIKKVKFYSLLKKNFDTENGENIEYYEAVVFPLDENGIASEEPEKIGVKKDALPLLETLQRDDVVTLRLEAYVKKPKVCAVKK